MHSLKLQKYEFRFFFLDDIWGCLVCNFKQLFSVFKQHFTYFNALFHPHVFPKIFSNNDFLENLQT